MQLPTPLKTESIRALARCVPLLPGIRSRFTSGPLLGQRVRLRADAHIHWKSRAPSLSKGGFELDSFPRADLSLGGRRGEYTLRGPLATSYDPFNGAVQGKATGLRLTWTEGRGQSADRYVTCLPLPESLKARWTPPGFLRDVDKGLLVSDSVLRLNIDGHEVDVTHLRGHRLLMLDSQPSKGPANEGEFRRLGEMIRRFLSYFIGLRLDADAHHLTIAQDGGAISTEWVSGRRRLAQLFNYYPVPLDPEDRVRCREKLVGKTVSGRALEPSVLGPLLAELQRRPGLATAIEYLLRWHEAPVEMRGAFLSVALESLTSEIKKEKKLKAPKPLPSDLWKKTVRPALREVIETEAKSAGTTGTVPLLARIDNLNSPTNREKLTQPFDALGISLSCGEITAIDKRNTLLHEGRILDEIDRTKPDAWMEPYMIEMRLFTVVNKLLLRFLGYEGPVIDWGAMSINSPHHEYAWVGA